MKHCVLIMGVSGSGKSSVGKLLAERLGLTFIEGDDYHSEANKNKMQGGNPLTDSDRSSWLANLSMVMAKYQMEGYVLACSALKATYREVLRTALPFPLKIFHLHGSKEVIAARMAAREHFMPVALLDSQLETLEITDEMHILDIQQNIEDIVNQIMISLGEK